MAEQIKIEFLKPCFIIKRFVSGARISNDKYNYEKYLLEFVNSSKIRNDYYSKKFFYNYNQSNGECDISNGFYNLDFKLFIPADSVFNLNLYSDGIYIDSNGAIIYSDSKKHGEYSLYNYLGLYNNFSIEDLYKIESKKQFLSKEESIIKRGLKNARTDKNIVYFIPIEVLVSKNVKYEEYLNFVIHEFYNYLINFIKFRTSYVQKDSYFCFLLGANIVFLKYDNDNFILYDVVNINKSSLFMELVDLSENYI